MLSALSLTAGLGLSLFAQASPVADKALDARAAHITPGTAIGGALDLSHRLKDAANEDYGHPLTLYVWNNLDGAITTSHNMNAGSPTPLGGVPPAGTIAPHTTAAPIIVPVNFAGNIAVQEANAPINSSCASLIEFSYTNGNTDVDISFVNGFTNAMVCSCNGKVVTGCNKNLYTTGQHCTSQYGTCCANPLRASTTATEAVPFFQPCQHLAYTYPNDNAANAFEKCAGQPITCCVGAACPANPGA